MIVNSGTYEYKMSKDAAAAYLSARKGEDKKLEPQEYLKKVVNEGYGLLGKCRKVIVD